MFYLLKGDDRVRSVEFRSHTPALGCIVKGSEPEIVPNCLQSVREQIGIKEDPGSKELPPEESLEW